MPSMLDKPYFRDEAAAYAKVESIIWPDGPVCVHCGERSRIGQLKGTATRPGVYKCYACRKQFRATVGTMFEGSHIALRHWLQAIYLAASSRTGVTGAQLHRALGITQKSAWFMNHRIRRMSDPSGLVPHRRGAPTPVIQPWVVRVKGVDADRQRDDGRTPTESRPLRRWVKIPLEISARARR